MAVRETLQFDISQALGSVGQIDARLSAAARNFEQQLAAATRQAAAGQELKVAGKVELQGADKAAGDLKDLSGAADKAGDDVDQLSKKTQQSNEDLNRVGNSALLAGAAIGAGFALAINRAADFEQQMSAVGAVSNATSKDMGLLRQAAIDAGAATVFSASEAAEAETELARAGVGVADILSGGLTGALNLAAAGQLDLATAATITATSLNIFHLAGQDATHVADVLAAAANKSAAGVLDLAEGLQVAGPVTSSLKISLEDTVGALALFADGGLKGSEAGNSLRRALLEMAAPTKQQQDLMDSLGISFFDAQGKFVGLAGASQVLQGVLNGQTDQFKAATLSTLGSAFGLQALQKLYEAGPAKIREYIAAVNDQGAAQDFASKQLDNLSGDLEQLSGSFETALITGGSKATGALRVLAQGATEAVNSFSALPGATQTGIIGILGLTSATLLGVGAFAKGVAKFNELKEALDGGGKAAQFMGQHLGTVTRAAGGLAIFATLTPILSTLTDNMESAAIASGVLAGALTGGLPGAIIGGSLATIASAFGLFADNVDHAAERVKALGQELSELDSKQAARTFLESFEALEKLDLGNAETRFRALRTDFRQLAEEAPANAQKVLDGLVAMGDRSGLTAAQLGILREAFSRGAATAREHADNTKETAAANDILTGSMDSLAGSTEEAATALDNFNQSIGDLIGLGTSAAETDVKWVETLVEAQAALAKNGETLDIATEKGRANRDQLIGLTEAALAHVQAVIEQNNSVEAGTPILEEHVGQLVATAIQLGGNTQETRDYIAQLLGIPASTFTDTQTTADIARAAVDVLLGRLGDLDGFTADAFVNVFANIDPALQSLGQGFAFDPRTGQVIQLAAGGPINAPRGTAVPIVAHGGEYVLSAEVVDAIKRGGPNSTLASSFTGGGAGGNVFHINVSGVNNDSDARRYGEIVGNQVVDALTRRNALVAARG